jgi:hypothetical protein
MWDEKWKTTEVGLRESRREKMKRLSTCDASLCTRVAVHFQIPSPTARPTKRDSTHSRRVPYHLQEWLLIIFRGELRRVEEEGVSNIQNLSKGNAENDQQFAIAIRNLKLAGVA